MAYYLPWAIGALIALPALFLVWRTVRRASIRARGRIARPPGIDILEKVRIGGIDQWLHVRGRDAGNPVLLFLHGGPGAAGIAFGRPMQAPWEPHFTVVQWDQRGGGKTFAANDPETVRPTMTLERFVEDTIEVVEHLRQRLGCEKVILLGHSWGTYLGLAVAQRRPDLVAAYVGSGQLVKPAVWEHLAYDLVRGIAERRGDAKALRALDSTPRPPWSMAEFARHNRTVNLLYVKYLDEIYGGPTKPPNLLAALGEAFCSPEYSLSEAWQITPGARFCMETMYGADAVDGVSAVRSLDVRAWGVRYEVPIFMFLGRHDYATPSQPAAALFEEIEAPRKALVWFERSGHSPMTEEPAAYLDALRRCL